VVTVPWVAPPKIAWAYSCTGVLVCYGVVGWPGNVDGAFTSIVNLPNIHAGDGHLNAEMWLQPPVPSGKTCAVFGLNMGGCWIEIGAKDGPEQCKPNIPCYFWNHVTPCDNCYNSYRSFWMQDIPSADINHQVDLRIERKGTSTSSFVLLLQSARLTLPDESDNNPVSPDSIQVGGELAGTTGAYMSPGTSFRNNQWKPVRANYYRFQLVDGYPAVGSPFIASWAPNHKPSADPTGGIWNVSCC
jgi:hypothetical protein